MDINEKALVLHETTKGKLKMVPTMNAKTKEDLSLAYSPGVAAPCLKIAENPIDVYRYTGVGNSVAVISDGSAVLGLGNIGAKAAMPVMEGKCLLMNAFANINATPIVLDNQDVETIIEVVKTIAPSFGAINLEDISAPRCVQIEGRLQKECNIPVFHDDQHGTAIVVLAALINVIRLTHKDPSEFKIVISGTGAAGSSIIKLLYQYGFNHIIAFDKDGCLVQDQKESYDPLKQELLDYVNLDNVHYGSIAQAMKDADGFIGVSVANIISREMVETMHHPNFVFALANPNPEISYENAKAAGATIIATGRSDYPNQVNNLLAFPGIFRGLLDARATGYDRSMFIDVSKAIASLVDEKHLSPDHILPSPLDPRVVETIASVVKHWCITHQYSQL